MLKKIYHHFFRQDKYLTTDKALIEKFISNPDFPYLVSFGRTGSHWLRNIMELYFEKPSLLRSFYTTNAKDFTCYHTHDTYLETVRKNVIYLYRNPVDTVYSQIKYHNHDTNNTHEIKYWTLAYAAHLSKWLLDENFTTKKTILTYEDMKGDINSTFEKVCKHLNCEFIPDKLANAVNASSKEKIKQKTKHDNQVINLSVNYNDEREKFTEKYSSLINEIIFRVDPRLSKFFQQK